MIQQRSAWDKSGEGGFCRGGDRDGVAGDHRCPGEVVGRTDFSSGFSRLQRGRERKKGGMEGLQGLRAAVLSRNEGSWRSVLPQVRSKIQRQHGPMRVLEATQKL